MKIGGDAPMINKEIKQYWNILTLSVSFETWNFMPVTKAVEFSCSSDESLSMEAIDFWLLMTNKQSISHAGKNSNKV